MEIRNATASLTGLLIASGVIILWAAVIFFFLTCDLSIAPAAIIIGIPLLTFLYTGLFITAHDAIHGSIIKGRQKLNKFFGSLCLRLYAFFPYQKIRAKHFLHHQFPASVKDPDYHAEAQSGFWPWYLRFMRTYITGWQILGMALIFNILMHLLKIPVTNLLLFWVVPPLLSTLQLFYFGTYLPHQETSTPFIDRHHARSNAYPRFMSFITCYHFGGYHWEHHEFPGTPWWQLPERRQTEYKIKTDKP